MKYQSFIQPFDSLASISWTQLIIAFVIYITLRTLLIQGGMYLAVSRFLCMQKKRVFQLPFSDGQLRSELLATLNTILIDSLLISSLVKFGPPLLQSGRAAFSFFISFIWFEIWFYVSHRAFHSRALYWLHKQHHVAKVTSPLTAMSFSILERCILILGGIGFLSLLSAWVPLSQSGVALYLLANYALNLYGHSNIELIPSKWLKIPFAKILNTSTYHALHHARYVGHFGLFTPFMDLFFNSYFNDYLDVQAAAYRGQGLTSLKQRLPLKGVYQES